jgi:hypothetical protein
MRFTLLDVLISEKQLQQKAFSTYETKNLCVVYIYVIHGYSNTFSYAILQSKNEHLCVV